MTDLAIVQLDTDEALVARGTPAGTVETLLITSRPEPESFHARIAHEIRNRRRIQIYGPEGPRLALERELVAINHHPEQIVDRDGAAPMTRSQIDARLQVLAAGNAM